MSRRKLIPATLDAETTPFKIGRVPVPFAWGFYTPEFYHHTWGPNATEEMIEFILNLPDDYVIFAHNGGRFDFHFLLEFIDNPVKIINGRIITAALGRHRLQDSYAIIPAPLRKSGQKGEIDYALFEDGIREKHKKEILDYLQEDCIALYNWVMRFIEEFGRKITVGSAAMEQLQRYHSFTRMPPKMDAYFREFYYGGRVECINPGIHKGQFKVYDVNSMYPTVMRDFRHPLNASYDDYDELPKDKRKVYFAVIDATSRGALPLRQDEGIIFPHGRHVFKACSHEIRLAQKFGLLDIHEVIECKVSQQTTTFGNFVNSMYQQRLVYKEQGDHLGDQCYKYIMNSSYGKFGTDPDNFRDWLILWEMGSDAPAESGYELYSTCEHFELWQRRSYFNDTAYFDVSIAASITSAARSVLLNGLQFARNALYCDTDSIICEELDLEVNSSKLGAWKIEETADTVVIAGKKLYALKDSTKPKDKQWIKVRSKGGTLKGPDILHIARGGEFLFQNPVPTFSPNLEQKFINRKFRKTAK